MHRADIAVGEALGRHALEQAGGGELCHDRTDAHRRLDIAPLLHMVERVVVVEHERDARLVQRKDVRLLRDLTLGVAGLAQADRIVLIESTTICT